MERDQELLDTIIRELVDYPNELRIERSVDEMGVLLSVHLNPEDMGKVIGRQGNTAKALRSIMRAVGMKNQARINIKIIEPAGSTYVHKASDVYPGDINV